jgi:hypothetical protein
MYKKFQCPDCEKFISIDAKFCDGCGWRRYNKTAEKICRCGKEAGVSNLCWDCYEHLRPKSELEIKAEEWRKKDREQAILEGCVTPEDFMNRTKRQLKISRFGKLVVNLVEPEKDLKPSTQRRHLELSDEARRLRDELDEKQQKKWRESVADIPSVHFENNAYDEAFFDGM